MVKSNISDNMAEQKLLGSIIYRPDKIIDVIDEINPSIFSIKEHGQIYKCIIELYKDDIVIDDVSIRKKAEILGFDIIPDLIKKLTNSTTFVTTKQLKNYCNIIKTSSFKRKTIDLCCDFTEKAKEMSSPEKIIDNFSNLVIDLSEKLKANNNESQIDIDEDKLLSSIDERYNNPNIITGIPFGFPTIDKYLDGAKKGYLISTCGHNSHGKSLFAQCCAINMALWLLKQKSKEKILFYSLEMTKKQMEERFISIITGIESKYFKNPKLYFIEKHIPDTQENFEKFKNNVSKGVEFLNKLPIVINDSSDLSAIQIVTSVKKNVLKSGVACVFVDYAGLVVNDDTSEEYQNICKTYKVFKQSAKDMQIPFVVLNQYMKSMQLNPKNGNRGTLFDIYGGKSVLNDSHVILHINFPQKCREYIEKNPEMIGKIIAYCDKNRDGIYGEMPDVIMSLKGGRLKEDKEIRKETEVTIENVFGGEE